MAFTYFFRDLHTLEKAVDTLIPLIAGKSKINIWDAGCAMGPEPYTLAILLAEKMNKFAFKNVRIYATDIDLSNLFGDIIEKGIYRLVELERIPKEIFNKYFTRISDDEYQLIDEIRSRLIFSQHDLTSLKPVGEDFSLILCKNVLLHLQHNERIEVIKMFRSSLGPNGIFATEQTQKLPPEVSDLFKQMYSDAQIFMKL